LSLDAESLHVTYLGSAVGLSPREFALLHALAERAGRAVSREVLTRALYGTEGGTESNTLEFHVHALRRKLVPTLIRTVRGFGYLLVKETVP
jgi:two-component system response regulator QseB